MKRVLPCSLPHSPALEVHLLPQGSEQLPFPTLQGPQISRNALALRVHSLTMGSLTAGWD